MFESAELGHKLTRRAYDSELPGVRTALLNAQSQLRKRGEFSTIVIASGVDGAGKGESVNLLSEWMDPRHIRVHALSEPSEEERLRPPMWRFWRRLPPKGTLGVFFGAWYSDAMDNRAYRRINDAELEHSLEQFVRFERMLVEENCLIIKLWFHLSQKKQREKFEKLEASKATSFRVTKEDWERHRMHAAFKSVAERTLRTTSHAAAPWVVVDGSNDRYRNLTVGKILLNALETRLAQPKARLKASNVEPPTIVSGAGENVLSALTLRRSIPEKEYEERLALLQRRLNKLTRHRKFSRIAVALVFEGSDAAGKGGTIRRITRALDARLYETIAIAAPTDEERAQPYLWRFWRQVPRKGKIAIFDRSWYGRVLVERIEGFCSVSDYTRAYEEINDFEHQLSTSGVVVVKFWLAISKDEQAARFHERSETDFKKHKITAEDWRNRKKWAEYERAACDMVDRTSTEVAAWHLIEADNKHFARIKCLTTLCESLEARLNR